MNKFVLILSMGILLLASVISCERDPSGSDSGIIDGGDIECSGSETRCYGGSHQICVDEKWTLEETCNAPQLCVEGLGCADCDPAHARICQDENAHACNSDGSMGDLVEDCGEALCWGGLCLEPGCSKEAQLIYLFDVDRRLYSFNPLHGANEVKIIPSPTCEPGEPWAEFDPPSVVASLAMDRHDKAWLHYTSGEIFISEPKSSAACSLTDFVPGQESFEFFLMGFARNGLESEEETLYIMGGIISELWATSYGDLGAIDPDSLNVTHLGTNPHESIIPEVAGTADGKLYAYYPGTLSHFVTELDKSDGSYVPGRRWDMEPFAHLVVAWSFAPWGGKFYLFVTEQEVGGFTHSILCLDPEDGTVETVIPSQPLGIILTASTSTCTLMETP